MHIQRRLQIITQNKTTKAIPLNLQSKSRKGKPSLTTLPTIDVDSLRRNQAKTRRSTVFLPQTPATKRVYCCIASRQKPRDCDGRHSRPSSYPSLIPHSSSFLVLSLISILRRRYTQRPDQTRPPGHTALENKPRSRTGISKHNSAKQNKIKPKPKTSKTSRRQGIKSQTEQQVAGKIGTIEKRRGRRGIVELIVEPIDPALSTGLDG